MADSHDSRTDLPVSRRHILRCSAVVVAAFAAPAALARSLEHRSLTLVHTHTGERLVAPYVRGGCYDSACLDRVNHFLRDFRTQETHAIDPALLDVLFALQVLADRDAAFEVISGFRSPATNRKLQRKSQGVATRSLHMEGKAIDVRLSGFSTARLRDHALSLKRGGVGYYAASDFVHVDTGRVRSW
ncbi:MAG: YcbK family protein [Steroidobacteraceae bacterium]